MSEPATQYQAIKGEGGEPQLGEGDSEFILPEGGAPRVIPPPPPMPVVVALCPGVECCDLSPFVYAIRRTSPTLAVSGGSGACSTCLNASYSTTIVATGIGPALTWTIDSGALPPGLVFHGGYNEEGQVLIDGTPNTGGNYSITVKATSPTGAFVTTVFPFSVFGITTSSLPNYTVGTPYIFQIQAAGGSGNYGWSIDSGALPDGLILDPTSGVIYGTPTGANSGTQPIVFKVTDITCEEFNPVFTPLVKLVTSSNTRIATVLGFDEYVSFRSTPPKRYHTLTWAGSSEHQLWWVGPQGQGSVGPVTPEQIAGARIDYSGSSTIDTNGNYTSLYTKNLFEMCTASDFLNPIGVPDSSGAIAFIKFKGWSGPTIPPGHQKCSPPSVPYAFVRNEAVGQGNNALLDFSELWGSKQISPGILSFESHFQPISATQGTCTDSGGTQTGHPSASNPPFQVIALDEAIPDNETIGITADGQGVVWFFATPFWQNNYSATLSVEYTDAEALANATSMISNSRLAENLPRTTGFVSRFTAVNYDLQCSNLVVGASYKVSIQFVDLDAGTTTTQAEVFVATSITHTINHNIPNPPPGHSVNITNPTIAFA